MVWGTAPMVSVDAELEAVIVCGHGDGLAGVDHAGVDALGGDHDGTALGYAPLHDDRPDGGAGMLAARRGTCGR